MEMNTCTFKTCNRPHPWTPGYPGGCPFEGWPSTRTRPRAPTVEEVITRAEHHRERERVVALQQRAAQEHDQQQEREHECGRLQTLVRALIAEHRQQVVQALATDLVAVHDLAAAQHAVDAHDVRELVRRVGSKL